MRHDTVKSVQRVFVWIFFLAVVGIGAIAARTTGIYPTDAQGLARQGLVPSVWNKQVALISGHAGNDSGAICEDANGQPTIQEADVNAAVARLAAERLRQAGADVAILDEYDARLEDMRVDVLLSLHADSCIDASGYKAAHHALTAIPDVEARLLGCIDSRYPAATGLAPHPNTVTHDMTLYHAFRRIAPTTPAAILEMGFLGGDQAVLTADSARVAQGVADSVLCFLDGQAP
jgi:N-acetylmuramoyl-L-alanine amidase